MALKRAQAKYAMTAFNSQWNTKLAVIVYFSRTTQNLVISRSCFAEDGNDVYKGLYNARAQYSYCIILLIKPFVC